METEIADGAQASAALSATADLLAPAALSKIRHDFKTPLNQIIGYAEMLLEDAGAAGRADAETSLRRLLDSAQACLEVQGRLLTRQPEELRPEHFQELKDDQTARSVYMKEILAELRAEPASPEWGQDLDKLGVAVSNLGMLARKVAATWTTQAEEKAPPAEAPAPALWLPGSESATAPEPGTARAGGRILVVDDNAGNRDMLSRRLEREGYSVDTAENGRKALEKLEAGGFDLVLLDIVMPELDGFAVLQSIRANQLWKEVAVIMISALDEIRSVVRCIEMGAEDYLPKPFDPVLLRARIGAILDRKRLRDEERLRTVQMETAFQEAERQKQVAETMLRNILPAKIAEELQSLGSVEPMYFEDVTIGFTDFVGFTLATEKLAAEEIVGFLNEYFTAFDRIVSRYGLEKMKTIGDSYMFVSGMPDRRPSHPVDAVLAALEMVEAVRTMARPEEGIEWQMRVGLHTGPVIAGVVGIHKFAFDVWGDSVNFSSRMESSGAPNRVNLSERTYSRVKDFVRCTPRGRVVTKDGREADMFFAEGVHEKLIDSGVEGIPAAFARRYRIYFQQPVRAFPGFLLR
jgi:class 3 adenylate cyclase/CheY-like chemotaxis protein